MPRAKGNQQTSKKRIPKEQWDGLTAKQQQAVLMVRQAKGGMGKKGAQKGTGKKGVQKRAGPTMEVPPQLVTTQAQISIQADWAEGALIEMGHALIGYLFTRDVNLSDNFSYPLFYKGIDFMIQGILKEIQGQAILEVAPKIINDIIAGLKPKSINYHRTGKVSYTWQVPQNLTPWTLPLPWGTMQLLTPDTDNGTYLSGTSAFAVPNGTSVEYNEFLQWIQALDDAKLSWLATVSKGDASVLDMDASAFARVYAYNQNDNQVGSVLNDVESEVPIINPALAHFCPYGLNVRYPSNGCIGLNSNSASGALNPLLTVEKGWFNKCPVQFYFLDFNDIFNRIVYYWINLNSQMTATTTVIPNTTLPFSQQDFKIVVRQALLRVFVDQWNVQLMDPTLYTGGFNNFIPFLVNGGTFSSNEFETFMLPILMLENLAALTSKANDYKPRGGSKINRLLQVPVLGQMSEDTSAVWTYSDALATPVFSTPIQNVINIATGFSSPITVNLNSSYYVSVKNMWNQQLNDFKGVSTEIGTIGNITPSNLPLSLFQRTVVSINDDRLHLQVPHFGDEMPACRNIANVGYKMNKFESWNKRHRVYPETKEPLAIAPSDMATLNYTAQYSAVPIIKDLQSILDVLWLPSIRLDPFNNTLPFTLNDWRVLEHLTHSLPLTSPDTLATGYLSYQQNQAQLCVTGLGRESNTTYEIVLKALTETGKGGILSSILGGVVKQIIPGAGSFVDSVASMIPF